MSPLADLCFKIAAVSGLFAVALFTGVYTWLVPWWRNPVGWTVVVLDLLAGTADVIWILALFFRLGPDTGRLVLWAYIALTGGNAAVVLHRTRVWARLHYRPAGAVSRWPLVALAKEMIRRRGRPLWASPGPREVPAPPEGD